MLPPTEKIERNVQDIEDVNVKCPYDKSHRMSPSRLQIHLQRCPEKPRTCTYNFTHQFKTEELLQEHMLNCPDSWKIYRYIECDANDSQAVDIQVINAKLPQPEEDWNDCNQITYNPAEANKHKDLISPSTGVLTKQQNIERKELTRQAVSPLKVSQQMDVNYKKSWDNGRRKSYRYVTADTDFLETKETDGCQPEVKLEKSFNVNEEEEEEKKEDWKLLTYKKLEDSPQKDEKNIQRIETTGFLREMKLQKSFNMNEEKEEKKEDWTLVKSSYRRRNKFERNPGKDLSQKDESFIDFKYNGQKKSSRQIATGIDISKTTKTNGFQREMKLEKCFNKNEEKEESHKSLRGPGKESPQKNGMYKYIKDNRQKKSCGQVATGTDVLETKEMQRCQLTMKLGKSFNENKEQELKEQCWTLVKSKKKKKRDRHG